MNLRESIEIPTAAERRRERALSGLVAMAVIVSSALLAWAVTR